jgi:hypothetical protein
MTLTQQEDKVLSAAMAGVSRVAELLATIPAEERSRALEAAEKSYLQTAHALGYKDAEAELWASEIMRRLPDGDGPAVKPSIVQLSNPVCRRASFAP